MAMTRTTIGSEGDVHSRVTWTIYVGTIGGTVKSR